MARDTQSNLYNMQANKPSAKHKGINKRTKKHKQPQKEESDKELQDNIFVDLLSEASQ